MVSRPKLILFDIDGTLVSPGTLARETMAVAVSDYLGHPVELSFHDVAGFTDPVIVRSALVRQGLSSDSLDGAVQTILNDYLQRIQECYPAYEAPFIFPGARELVLACQAEGWTTALLTGNLQPSARLKIERFDLWDLFAFGVFGDDGNAREDLPWIARERAWDALQLSFRTADTILIGDTPNDARIAALNGIASLIVCRRDEPEWRQAIQEQQPTWLVEDFEDIPELIRFMGNAES